jgi:FkbM family methyltransferase
VIRRLVRYLHLSAVLKSLFSWLLRVSKTKKNLYYRDLKATFFVDSYERRLALRNFFCAGVCDETPVLSSLLDCLQAGDTAWDIGANIGIHAIFMAIRVGPQGRVIAVEPEDRNHRSLQANVQLNRLKNISIIHLALGEKIGEGCLYVNEMIGLSSCSLIEAEDRSIANRTKILPGDDLVRVMNLPVPKALKIDVEGHEYSVLLGLRETLADPKCRLICFEFHDPQFSGDPRYHGAMNLLGSLGFSNCQMQPRGSEWHIWCSKDHDLRLPFCRSI